MKNKLIKGGIIESEIAFIHDFNTEVAKDRLFKDMNDGNIRVLFGSTANWVQVQMFKKESLQYIM